MYVIKFKHGVQSNKNRNNTSMHELPLELKNKSQTQTKQSKNYSKNYHKIIMNIKTHGKKMTQEINKNML